MTTAALIAGFFGWAVAILTAGVLDGGGSARTTIIAQRILKVSGWALAILMLATVVEVWWQEGPLHFASSPTANLIVPIEDHGTKYVTPEDARVIKFFDKLFFLLIFPFLAHFGVQQSKAKAERNSGRNDV